MGFFNNDKGSGRLLTDGELIPATIYAIRVEDNGREWSYGLDVRSADGPRRLSVRQELAEEPQLATLGAPVMVRYLDGEVAIDWRESLQALGVERETVPSEIKALRQPLEAGIQDDRIDTKRLNKWASGTAKIVSFNHDAPPNWNLEVELDSQHNAGHALLNDELVPSYAEHLLAVGTQLPLSINPDDFGQVAIDWPAAAENASGSALRVQHS